MSSPSCRVPVPRCCSTTAPSSAAQAASCACTARCSALPSGNATKLLLLVQTVTAKGGDTLLVDDADVWASATGDCKDAR